MCGVHRSCAFSVTLHLAAPSQHDARHFIPQAGAAFHSVVGTSSGCTKKAMRSTTMLSPCNEPCEHGCALLLVHCLITADPPTTCMNQPSRHWCPSCPRHSYHHHHHHHHHHQDSTSWHAVPLLLTYCISRAPDPTQPQLHTSDTPVCPAAAAPPAMLGQA